MTTPENIHRDKRHDHYWIDKGDLYESYMTHRGMRHRHLMAIPSEADNERLCDAEIERLDAYLDTCTTLHPSS